MWRGGDARAGEAGRGMSVARRSAPMGSVMPHLSAAAAPVSLTAPLRVTAPSPKEDIKIPLPAKLVVGAIAGIVGTSAAFPLDMVKTRMQSQKVGPDGTKVYKNAIDCFRQIIRHEGARGLYKGLGANLTGVAPEKAIKLTVNDFFRDKFTTDGHIPVQFEALSGALAGLCQVTATNPMEITKIRMQMQMTLPVEKRVNTMGVVRQLGLRGMYHGAGMTLMRDIPYSILFFPGYAHLRHLFADGHEGTRYILGVFVAGGLGSAIPAGFCTPMDVVKTRIQAPGGRGKYKGAADCARQILRDEGIFAFYKGAVPRMLVQAPLFAVALLAFELQKNFMRAQLNKERDARDAAAGEA
uniref:Uncharacterized protein n=1 Tax=Bicosoecida sp. CB-2014 TaxID=1486930 RepID=A0A7S1CAX8_9STRA|mmetsp:Transcript_19919/g.70467  ORF Transcript_19919/g.70467 Transcript_19919/m.70467 type:complete len:354 (+) Transcript_19919:110-1171(+)